MASGIRGPVGPELQTLFEAGTVVGRSDGELLDRFLAAGGPAAEPAFAALVERHGAMVWRVCRDVLRESNDADDAFQATFLVLARRAGAIRTRSSLGPWLYGVALRVARSARTKGARRRSREQLAAQHEREESVSDVDRLDAAPIVHEEVGRLPAKYRSPLVLCYFEGLTHDQAASQLGWPVGTVRSRMAEARDRLRPRLLRRGVAPSVAILAATGRAEASAIVPAALVSATVRMAVGACTAGAVPAAVAALVGTALRKMTIMKLSMFATGLVAATLVGAAGVRLVVARPQNTGKAVTPKQDAPAAKADAQGANPLTFEMGLEQPSPASSYLRSGASSPRVLWAKLNAAATNFEIARASFEKAEGGYGAVAAARGEVDSLAAELNTCVDDLSDALDLLQIQLMIRKADLQAAQVQLGKANDMYTSTEDLRKKKVISSQELRLSQQEVDFRTAEVAKKQAEMDEVALRIKQATRRRDEAVALSKRAKGLVPEQQAPARPATPAVKP